MKKKHRIDSIEYRIERLRLLISATHMFCSLVDMAKRISSGDVIDPRLEEGYVKMKVALAEATEAINGARYED